MPNSAGVRNALIVSISQDIAFCRVFIGDLYLSLTEVSPHWSPVHRGSNGGRSPGPSPFPRLQDTGKTLNCLFLQASRSLSSWVMSTLGAELEWQPKSSVIIFFISFLPPPLPLSLFLPATLIRCILTQCRGHKVEKSIR